MSEAEQLANIEDVDELPDDLRARVYDRVAATLETVDDVLADLDAEDVPEGSR